MLVIDALIAQKSMSPFLHLWGEPVVNVAWTVIALSPVHVCSIKRQEEAKTQSADTLFLYPRLTLTASHGI